jgi:hypothetical protein
MKKILIYISVATVAFSASTLQAFAGNEDRAGQSGAHELLINPWAKNSGWGVAGLANARGVESFGLNPACAAYSKGTDISFSQTDWLRGSDIKISAFGISQKVGESGALGLTFMSMNFGEIERLTESNPDGGNGTYSPQFLNIGLTYAKEFSNSIKGGITTHIVSESINDVKAQGIAIDVGIQYTTGNNADHDNVRFGIALRNVGTPMKYQGEGLSFRNDNATQNINVLQEQRTESFELPALVSIGGAYDIKTGTDSRITTSFAFTSNSFIRDQIGVGVEYGFKNSFAIRAGYTIDKKDKNAIIDEDITALKGLSGGLTYEVPLGKSGKRFGIDYSYRATKTFDGTHSIGAHISL